MKSLNHGSSRTVRAKRWVASLILIVLPAVASAGENELTAGYSQLQYNSFTRPSRIYSVVELAYHRPAALEGTWSALRVGAGLRAGPSSPDTSVPVEGFIQAQLTLRLGPWAPAVGPELGVSGFARLFQRTLIPADELYRQENALLGPVYVGFTAAPLRFTYLIFSASALEVFAGTNAFPFGTATRLQVQVLKLGITL